MSAIAAATVQEKGFITDLCLIHWDKGEEIPLGFSPVMEASGGQSANLNFGSGSSEIYLCVQREGKDLDGKPKDPITEIGVYFTDSGWMLSRKESETLPTNSGWVTLNESFYGIHSGDLNAGSGREIFLAYRREPKQSPISSISVYWPQSKDPLCAECPKGYIPVTKTITGKFDANLNTGKYGKLKFVLFTKLAVSNSYFCLEMAIFLCYETKIAKYGWDPRHGIKVGFFFKFVWVLIVK
jgi:hypothetical protein